jgi:PIN domain nuclease of toxin-antitoxin system
LRLLLDTSTFIWAATSPERVSQTALDAITGATLRELSTLSLSEIAIKQAKGKLNFPRDNVEAAIEDLRLHLLPYNVKNAYQLFNLPLHHKDPFDRMIIAQALAEDIPVVTSDAQFRLYRNLKVIW